MRRPVLHVIPFLWSGAGVVLTRLCEAQREQGPVAIVTTGRRGEEADWPRYRARLRRAGVTHHTIDFFSRGDPSFWASAQTLADLMTELRPAVVHAHAGVPCCGAVVARDRSGVPCRVIGQMYSWGPNRPEWMNVQDMWGFSRADRVICSARAYWDLLVEYGVPKSRLDYLPWGLPLDALPFTPAVSARASGDAPTLGFVGRIEPRKGQLDLVEALARLRRRLPGARLELVGPVADEAYGGAVRQAITAHGLTDAVRLHGEVSDVTRHVRDWDVFVSLSSDEGQGLAVLEAMALGVPVAARPVAGIVDFLTADRTGVAIEHSSPARVAAAVTRLLETPALRTRVARQARRLVERRYAWSGTVEAFERLYWSRELRRQG